MKKVNDNRPAGRRRARWATTTKTKPLSIKLICMAFRLKYIMVARCCSTFALIFKINKSAGDTDQITCNVSNELLPMITREWRTTNGDKSIIIIGRRRKLPIQKWQIKICFSFYLFTSSFLRFLPCIVLIRNAKSTESWTCVLFAVVDWVNTKRCLLMSASPSAPQPHCMLHFNWRLFD